MDLIYWILLVFAVLALACIIGMVRNWSRRVPGSPLDGPAVRLTWAGWWVALGTVVCAWSVVVAVWWWLGPRALRVGPPWRPSLGLAGGAALVAGLLFFFGWRGLLGRFGIRLWESSEVSGEDCKQPGESREKRLGYRLDEVPQDSSQTAAEDTTRASRS